MQPYYLLFIILIVLCILFRTQKAVVARKVIENRRQKGNTDMVELAKMFIGKECLIYAFDSNHQYQGIIRVVSNGAVLVENGDTMEAINLDFVIRIREFPKNKKGKKKSVVLD